MVLVLQITAVAPPHHPQAQALISIRHPSPTEPRFNRRSMRVTRKAVSRRKCQGYRSCLLAFRDCLHNSENGVRARSDSLTVVLYVRGKSLSTRPALKEGVLQCSRKRKAAAGPICQQSVVFAIALIIRALKRAGDHCGRVYITLKATYTTAPHVFMEPTKVADNTISTPCDQQQARLSTSRQRNPAEY